MDSLPDVIAEKIASLLEVPDVCALGSCSRFWRSLCGSESIWESLVKKRWTSLTLFDESSSSTPTKAPISKGWRGFYIKRHKEMAGSVSAVTKFVEQSLRKESLDVGDYLKAIEDLSTMQVGFKDIQMFIFKPKCNVLLNLVGLHYCLSWLKVQGEDVIEALQSCKISDRRVCVKWWKLGPVQREYNSCSVSPAGLALAKMREVLSMLKRRAIYDVRNVQISVADPTSTPWSCRSAQRQD